MIIVIETLSNEKLKKYWSDLAHSLKNTQTLIGNKDWTYVDWMNQLQSYEHNVIVLDSWMRHRANARLDNATPKITDNEAELLNHYVGYTGGHIDFITNKDEESSLEDIKKELGCLDEYAKKVFNEITYEVLQSKMFVLTNRVIR